MASSEPQHNGQPPSDAYGTVSEYQGNRDDHGSLRVENNRAIHGNDDIGNETQLQDEKPVSADTGHSRQLEFDDPDEAARFTSLIIQRKQGEGDVEENLAGTGSILTRPDSPGKLNKGAAFLFAKPRVQQMDFVGTRKGAASNVPPASDHVAQTGDGENMGWESEMQRTCKPVIYRKVEH